MSPYTKIQNGDLSKKECSYIVKFFLRTSESQSNIPLNVFVVACFMHALYIGSDLLNSFYNTTFNYSLFL